MAGDWIKVENVTPDKPEVFVIAERLSIDPDAVVGKLVRIWIWADQQTTDGDAPSVTRALLNRLANSNGFADAMLEAGWLTDVDGRLRFPNFDSHNGQTSKQRALTAKRMTKHRSKCDADRDAPSVTKSSPEKRREEIKNPLTPKGGILEVNRKRRKRDQFEPPPEDRSSSAVKAWIAQHPEATIPRDHSTVGNICRAATENPAANEFLKAVDRIAKGGTK